MAQEDKNRKVARIVHDLKLKPVEARVFLEVLEEMDQNCYSLPEDEVDPCQ